MHACASLIVLALFTTVALLTIAMALPLLCPDHDEPEPVALITPYAR